MTPITKYHAHFVQVGSSVCRETLSGGETIPGEGISLFSSWVRSSAHHFFKVTCYLPVLMGKFGNSCPRKMESDRSLSVLILILFLFSWKLVLCARFKCHQVSVTHFLSLMYCKTFWCLFCSLLHSVFQILFWPRYSFVPLGFTTLSWRVCLWVRASPVRGTFPLPA